MALRYSSKMGKKVGGGGGGAESTGHNSNKEMWSKPKGKQDRRKLTEISSLLANFSFAPVT